MVRRGGATEVLALADHAVWRAIQRPLTASALTASCSEITDLDLAEATQRLWSRRLLVWFDSWDAAVAAVGPLRIVPRWTSLGHVDGDRTRFHVGNEAGAVSVLDPVEALLSWELDGTATAGQAADRVSARLGPAQAPLVPLACTRLVLDLATRSLARVDATTPDPSGG
ncbi:MAG: hypothetical protein R2711_12265 [Acidimicrobiales bacterium]